MKPKSLILICTLAFAVTACLAAPPATSPPSSKQSDRTFEEDSPFAKIPPVAHYVLVAPVPVLCPALGEVRVALYVRPPLCGTCHIVLVRSTMENGRWKMANLPSAIFHRPWVAAIPTLEGSNRLPFAAAG